MVSGTWSSRPVTVRTGDRVDGWTIEKIEPDRIRLSWKDETFVLKASAGSEQGEITPDGDAAPVPMNLLTDVMPPSGAGDPGARSLGGAVDADGDDPAPSTGRRGILLSTGTITRAQLSEAYDRQAEDQRLSILEALVRTGAIDSR